MAPPSPPADVDASTRLDHVAVAVEQWSDAWPRYVHELGGTWHSGGVNVGFSPAQLKYANGARIEILQPWEPASNPFLRRFLDHSGPGPHHLTFKVGDIEAALRQVGDAGFDPVGVRLDDPQWREAFLHPRQATGVVVQMAQAEHEWIGPAPEGFPTGPLPPALSLRHVTHVVRHLDGALELFQGLLGGRITGRHIASEDGWEAVDVAWPGPLALRLVSPVTDADPTSTVRTWLGDRPGRIHHLAFELPDSGAVGNGPDAARAGVRVPGVVPGQGLVRVVEGEDNLGTRLVLWTSLGVGGPS
jgi:catechol 2,3-dioxygenase-like lactoylglutathione lyase family enzyme